MRYLKHQLKTNTDMKKVFSTILLSCFTLLLSAEVYYLLPNSDGWNSEAVTSVYDNTTIEGNPNQLQWEDPYQPERKAYEWFKDHYNAGDQKVITYKDLKDGRLNVDGNLFSTVKVLWIHVDRFMDVAALDNLFPQDVRDAIANYVKAGGNVYLSTYAARLAHLIGRAPEPGEFKENNGFGVGNDEWKVLADFSDNYVNHTHAIYKYLIANNLYGQKSNGLYFFHMQKGSPRSDRNCLWDIPNNLDAMNAFQNDHTCKVLGSWGHTEQFECAGLVEFYPKGDWKGTIIANGLAACSWASTNTDVHCVQHLTRGVLDYLNTSLTSEPVWGALSESIMRIGGGFELHNSVTLSSALPEGCTLKFYSNDPVTANTDEAGGVYCNYFGKVTFRAEIKGDGINAPKNIMWQANSPELTVDGSSPAKYGYILPYSLHTMSNYGNENGNRPDFVSADWFNVNYIIPDNGCFLNPQDYNATNLIPQKVEVLWIHNDHVGLTSDQYFTDLGRENFVAALREFVDRGGKVFLSKQATRLVGDLHLLGIYDNQIDYYYPSYPQASDMGYISNGDPWSIKNTYTYDTQTIDYSSHHVYKDLSGNPVLQTKDPRTNNNYRIEQIALNGEATYEDFIATEQKYQCRLLGCFSNNQEKHDGAIFAEFLPRTAGQGTVIMMGAAAYHWTGSSIDDINSNLKTLTKNILDYLATIETDVYTRDVTNGNYGTICLPRASKTITGATMWRAVEKNEEGVVIEQVSAMEAGVPYFFQATADVLRVEMQGETKPAGKANGLVGYINVEGEMLQVPQGDHYYVLYNNELYFVDSDVYLPTNYAYVDVNEMSSLAPVAGMPRHTMRLPQSENATTALDNMQTTSAPTKIIQNGQVYILRDGHIYTTLGTQVK